MKTLGTAIKHSRRDRAAEKDVAYEDLAPETLLGECPYNAADLLNALEPYWAFGPVAAVRGGLNLPGEPNPTTIEEAENDAQVHWWVEAWDATMKKVWTVDIASEVPRRLGQPLIQLGSPEEYVGFGERFTLSEIENEPFFTHY